MSGGWAGSARKATLPDDWDQRCAQVHARSGLRCEWPVVTVNLDGSKTFRRCNRPANGGVDHFKDRLYHQLDGLRDSCQAHHGRKSSREGNQAQADRRARGKQPPEPHPGIIRRKS